MKKAIWFAVIFGSTLFFLSQQEKVPIVPKEAPPIKVVQPPPIIPVQPPPKPLPPPEPRLPQITTQVPGYLNYRDMIGQLNKWKTEAPDFVDVGTYGQSSRGADLYFIRVTNKLSTQPKKKVLITACIHGNEPLASSVVLGYIGTMLASYNNSQIKQLLDTRDIYFVPIFSPDSFPHSRFVDGVDPNRNFPGPRDPNKQSVAPVVAIQRFFLQHNFNAVISGHTSGRVFLTPYGDRNELSPDDNVYKSITRQMAFMSGYQVERACEMYGHPIYGSEVDWYYRHGAISLVMEFGTNQRIPSMNDTQHEMNLTYKAFLYFLEEATKVESQSNRVLAKAA